MSSKAARPQRDSNMTRNERGTSTPSEPESPPQMGETAEMRERRRKQNRIAQQAFRARQKVRVDALESEWQQLRQLHESLNQAYSQRSKEIEQLHSRVETLLQDIEFLKSSQEIERGWPSSPSSSCASSSYASSSHAPRLPQQNKRAVPQFDLSNYFSKGGFSEFPEFPLHSDWVQGNSRRS